MAKVEEVKVLNIDEVPYAVDSMSAEVQEMVEVFNDWNRKEAEIVDDLRIIRAAKNNLSMQIIQQVREEKEEAEAAEDNTEAPAVETAEVPAE